MVRYDLKPLAYKDVRKYVEHRMRVAGGGGNPDFTNSAIKEIYDYSGGNPRRINSVCDRSLLIAYAGEKYTVSKSIARKAVMDLSGNPASLSRSRGWSLNRYLSYAFLLLILIIVAGLGGWRYMDGFLKPASGGGKEVIAKIESPRPEPPGKEKKVASLFLDEKDSLTFLFSSYYRDHPLTPLNLVEFNLEPEYYVMLKRPFRVPA
jgi:hypothetical protein